MIPTVSGATVESFVPGRIRVRVPKEQRRELVFTDVKTLLEKVDGIRCVSINQRTGSVLVEYDPDVLDLDELISLGRAANIVTDVEEQAFEQLGIKEWPTTSDAARRVISGFRKVDTEISDVTGGFVDAKTLIPLAIFALAVGRALVSQRKVAAPWYSLMWYAYSMFMHWHNPTRGKSVTV